MTNLEKIKYWQFTRSWYKKVNEINTITYLKLLPSASKYSALSKEEKCEWRKKATMLKKKCALKTEIYELEKTKTKIVNQIIHRAQKLKRLS